jgi:hypothetical protein
MHSLTNLKPMVAMALGAVLALCSPLMAQTRAIRADLPVSTKVAADREIARASGSALAAGVPTLGVVELDGAIYKMDGIPGGASLQAIASLGARRSSSSQLLSTGGGSWVRSARASRLVEIADQSLRAEIPVGALALSRLGAAMAVADTTGARIDIYALDASGAQLRKTADFAAGSGVFAELHIDENASSLLAIVAHEGWMQAVAWDAETGKSSVLMQGGDLRAAVNDNGARLAIFDAAMRQWNTFARGAGGFTLAASHRLPVSAETEGEALSTVAWLGSQFVATTIRGRSVELCFESGACESERLPIASARSIRTTAAANVLFVESARRGVPSYLLEFEGSHRNWHFIGRNGGEPRSAPMGRGPAARTRSER